jgi:hypothetical protein
VKNWLIALSWLAFVHAPGARADSFFIEKANGVSVGEGETASTTEMIRQAVIAMKDHRVVPAAEGADLVLRPKIVKLGSSYVVSLEKLAKGSVVRSGRLKAANLDELDTVAARLARAVVESKDVESDARVTDLTEAEAKRGSQRRQARQGYLVGLGPDLLYNAGSDGPAYGVSAGYAWDITDAWIKLAGDFSSRGGAGLLFVGIHGNYFFSERDVSPFVSAALGYGSAFIKSSSSFLPDTAGGFAFSAGGGLTFLRTSSINLELGLHYLVIASATSLGTPMAAGARLTLFFPR